MTNQLIYLFIAALLVSNAYFAYLYFREKKKKSKDKHQSLELSEFLSDILNGEAMVRVTRVAPVDVFLRSPRHGRQ